jgi:Bacterial cellulose synthase subunit
VTSLSARVLLVVFLTAIAPSAQAQQRGPLVVVPSEPGRVSTQVQRAAVTAAAPAVVPEAPRKSLLVGVPFVEVGLPNGFRLSNLGGRREIYIPVPQGIELGFADLVLTYDDVSAHDAKRSLEILVNDRSVASLALDGKSTGRTVHIPLAAARAHEGFLKLSFLYSGAATQDRCIDVRYVGDSLTVRPESAVEFEIGVTGVPNITATAALMPRDVAILLSNPALPPTDIAAALTVARSLAATGKHVTFYHGVDTMPELVDRDDRRRWTRGLVVVGAFGRIAGRVDAPVVTQASATGTAAVSSNLAAARIGGVPVLLVSEPASARTAVLPSNPSLSALRDAPSASVREVSTPKGPIDRVSFDALGLVAAQAEVFGRADLEVSVPGRILPSGTRPSRLVLDLMVAPDSAGEKAVVSVFVNERLLASTVAMIGEPTRLDFALSDGLVGSVANIRVVIQRRSSQGDCRFEPQGYPAEILGSSSIILSAAGPVAQDFSDLATLWANGVEILVPESASEHPLSVVASLADILNALSKETAPIEVKYIRAGATPAPGAPFIAVSNVAPLGAKQRVLFDRGRVAITDRAGYTLLDIDGLATGAVAQIVTSNAYPGLWIKPLASDGSLPTSPAVNLDRGDVAFLDKIGVALALSTEHDTLLRVFYADEGTWFARLDRYRSAIVVCLWGIITLALIFVLQRIYRRRNASAGE